MTGPFLDSVFQNCFQETELCPASGSPGYVCLSKRRSSQFGSLSSHLQKPDSTGLFTDTWPVFLNISQPGARQKVTRNRQEE